MHQFGRMAHISKFIQQQQVGRAHSRPGRPERGTGPLREREREGERAPADTGVCWQRSKETAKQALLRLVIALIKFI